MTEMEWLANWLWFCFRVGMAWVTLAAIGGVFFVVLLRVAERIDLSAYLGEMDVQLKFELKSDQSLEFDGWYLDDIVVSVYRDSVAVGVEPGAKPLPFETRLPSMHTNLQDYEHAEEDMETFR